MINRFLKPEERYARRMARIARWDRPIDGSAGRLRAWAHMALVDHGVFRFFYLNRHQVSPNLWRSAQPAPHQLAWFAERGPELGAVLAALSREHYMDVEMMMAGAVVTVLPVLLLFLLLQRYYIQGLLLGSVKG